jgi:hypothetical protein
MLDVRNVSSDKGVFDITRKEITIPLVDYTDGTIGIVKEILQIDDPEDKK